MPSDAYTQDRRFLSLTTALGKDVLLLNSFSVSERVSGLYRIELDVLFKPDQAVDPKKLLNTPASVALRYGDLTRKERYFHGIVSEVGIGGETERFRHARFEVVPKLWLLTLASHFRVFDTMSVPDIVKRVLAEYGIQTKWNLSGSYTNWDFCFQYRETDFNFISRLLEHEGIFYYFEHASGNHTMVFADRPDAFKKNADQPGTNFAPETGLGAAGADFVMSWELSHALRTGGYQLWDWHFEKAPSPSPASTSTAESVGTNTSYKLTDFPGAFVQQFNRIDQSSGVSGEGSKIVQLRMDEIEADNPVYRGNSSCRAYSSGQRFTLSGGHYPGDYAILAVEHAGSQYPPYLYGMESSLLYTNSMTCIPFGKTFRPPRTAQRSLVQGPQTALVIEGPDKYGRFRVKFHWGDQTTSGWIRVAQRWAGPQWGTVFLPRIEHEVIIDFIDGDPDQPIIVGSVYNKQNMPPYKLPDKYTQSGIKTRSMNASGSSQGGGDEFNELRFDDLQGNEDIYFHAQKDFHRYVEHDDDLQVENNQTIRIHVDRTEKVETGNEKVTVEKGNRDVILDMGTDTLHIKMGNHIRKIDMGKSETEAMQSITLKVGANSIKIDQSGITLDGIMIQLKGQAMIKSQAPLQQMSGDATVIIKGGITMIN